MTCLFQYTTSLLEIRFLHLIVASNLSFITLCFFGFSLSLSQESNNKSLSKALTLNKVSSSSVVHVLANSCKSCRASKRLRLISVGSMLFMVMRDTPLLKIPSFP